jgi:hypothetical protein
MWRIAIVFLWVTVPIGAEHFCVLMRMVSTEWESDFCFHELRLSVVIWTMGTRNSQSQCTLPLTILVYQLVTRG